MPQGKGSDARYILEELQRQLIQIQRSANVGYWVDVPAVYLPGFAPLANDMWNCESGCLFLWAMKSPTGDSLIGRPRRILSVWIAGVIKQQDQIQETLVDFAECVRGVMLFTFHTTLPGAMGIFVQEEEDGIAYQVDKADGGYAGVFLSKWGIQYDFTNPAG